MSVDERIHHLFGRMPDVKVHMYGKGSGPAANWATSTSSAGRRRRGRRKRAERAGGTLAFTHAEWTDGWDGMDAAQMTVEPRVGLIMGSDSDWSVMAEAAEALAEFDVPFEVGVSAHRTPGRMLDYAAARPTAACR